MEPGSAALGGPARATANPPAPGPGFAPGNINRTGEQADPGSVGGGTVARPERYLLVVEQDVAGHEASPHYLLARWPDWPHPALLATDPPAEDEDLEHAVGLLLASRMGVRLTAPPRVAPVRVPARMRHPRTGVEGLGWLRAVSVTVAGEPEPDALLAGIDVLTADAALDALPTEVERIVFRAGLAAT